MQLSRTNIKFIEIPGLKRLLIFSTFFFFKNLNEGEWSMLFRCTVTLRIKTPTESKNHFLYFKLCQLYSNAELT